MEITRDQPFNVFDKHRAQTGLMQIIPYLLMVSGILISVWLLRALKEKQYSAPPLDLNSKSGHGWSLDLTDKGS